MKRKRHTPEKSSKNFALLARSLGEEKKRKGDVFGQLVEREGFRISLPLYREVLRVLGSRLKKARFLENYSA